MLKVHQETGAESRIASDSSSEPKPTACKDKPDKKLVCINIVYVVHSYMTFNLMYYRKQKMVGWGGGGGGLISSSFLLLSHCM